MTGEEKEIFSIYRKLSEAMINKNVDSLRSIMKDVQVIRHISGTGETLDEWLKEIENEDMKYYSIEIRNVQITVDGDHALLKSTNTIEARIYGE